MCFYANAFVAGKTKESIVLPDGPDGLLVTIEGEINTAFSNAFKSKDGVFLVFHDGHCLCQFKEWKRFFEYADKIRQANEVNALPLMKFFVGEEYSQRPPQEIDLDLDDASDAPENGVIFYVGTSIRRRFVKYTGRDVSVLFKNGSTIIGTLKGYNREEEYGEILVKNESVYFNANEIRDVDLLV
ncbi:MAG: hypothetical protein E4H14_14570 [Candidatus Thorarchaeota archaeon]|nr:MAG: hypothetical protein E4H14_14570 [Candidatus Thorarchaeota archaeon]